MNSNDPTELPSSRRLRTIAILPSLITLLNGVCGFASIHFTARGMNEPHRFWLEKTEFELTFFAAAAWMIFLAMIADALDGFLARRAGSSSDFGGQLDSLSDIISFGVAPAFLMLRLVENHLQENAGLLSGSLLGRLLWLVAAIYLCCTALRLARFNVENAPDESAHMRFSGLPSPAAAGAIAALVLLYSDIGPELRGIAPEVTRIGSPIIVYLLPFITIIVAILMVSRIPYVHLTNQYLKGRKPFFYLVILVLLSIPLFWNTQITLAIGTLTFSSSGLASWLWQKRRDAKQQRALSAEPASRREP